MSNKRQVIKDRRGEVVGSIEPDDESGYSSAPISFVDKLPIWDFLVWLIFVVSTFFVGAFGTWWMGGFAIAIVQQILENKADMTFSRSPIDISSDLAWYGGGIFAALTGIVTGKGEWRQIISGFLLLIVIAGAIGLLIWLMYY